jgi:hypothetical protein
MKKSIKELLIWESRWINVKGTYYIVRAKTLDLLFPENREFSAGGIRFIPLKHPRRRGAGTLAGSCLTGEARFVIRASSWTEAVRLASEGILQVASDLLSFAQRRPVRFYRISLEDERHVFRRISHVRTLQAVPSEPRVSTIETAAFLQESMTRLKTLDMPRHTLVMESVKWVNEATYSAPTPEMRFLMLWMALETCMGVDEPGRNRLLSKDELESLRGSVREWAEKQGLDIERTARLTESIGNVNSINSRNRIIRFCHSQNIRVCEEDVSAFVDARNALQHEPWARPANLLDLVTRLDETAGKCILSQLSGSSDLYSS